MAKELKPRPAQTGFDWFILVFSIISVLLAWGGIIVARYVTRRHRDILSHLLQSLPSYQNTNNVLREAGPGLLDPQHLFNGLRSVAQRWARLACGYWHEWSKLLESSLSQERKISHRYQKSRTYSQNLSRFLEISEILRRMDQLLTMDGLDTDARFRCVHVSISTPSAVLHTDRWASTSEFLTTSKALEVRSHLLILSQMLNLDKIRIFHFGRIVQSMLAWNLGQIQPVTWRLYFSVPTIRCLK